MFLLLLLLALRKELQDPLILHAHGGSLNREERDGGIPTSGGGYQSPTDGDEYSSAYGT